MSQTGKSRETVELEIENIGGIDRSRTELSPGVTVLAGRNATNRTSLLQAIMAACGSDRATLKADADEGRAVLSIDGEEYTREYVRRNGAVVDSGDPYLEDATIADLFAFLIETNEARRAVERGDDLREIIMRPVDTDRIEAEIEELEAERAEVEAELEELEQLERQLPDLEAERQARIEAIEETEAELAEVEEEIEELDEDLQETREEKSDLEDKLDELGEVRNELQTVRSRIDSEEESVAALEEEREELESDLETYSEVPDTEIDAIDDEMSTIRGRIQEIDETIDEIGSIIQFNEDLIEESRPELVAALQPEEDGGGGSVTDDLVSDGEELTCWTCGSEVRASDVESTLDRLRSLRDEKLTRRNELDEELDELKNEKIELTEKRRQHDQIEESLDQVESEITRRTERIEDLNERREELAERVAELEAEVEERETEDYSEVLEVHREANELEFELERLEDELGDIEAEIDRIESRLEDRETLRARREEIGEELTGLRTRVEQLEADANDAFNEHMDSILELLEYENLERIWIERTEPDGPRRGDAIEESRFDLHVVRSTESGTVYEDRIDHLSESEREVTGVVFALAGYLVHSVHEEVPFMLLDSIEAIDADRIAQLVEYIAEYTDYLVVALLEEDAAALDDEHTRITSI